MNYRTILICRFLVAPSTIPAAELRERITLDGVTSQGIDLDAVSKSGSRKSVLIRASFVEDERTRCPEDSGQLQIWHGTLAQIRMALLSDPDGQGSSNGWRSTLNPVDDETYQYRVALPNCRTSRFENRFSVMEIGRRYSCAESYVPACRSRSAANLSAKGWTSNGRNMTTIGTRVEPFSAEFSANCAERRWPIS
jgi:hypothetical protein